MGKNKNKQKEIVNDLDIKKEKNMEVKNTENLTDIFIEKDNKIKELEEEIKRLKSLEILEEKLKEKENALNLRESEIKKLEDDLKNRKRVLDSENERVNFLEKSINNDSERLSKKASELNTQETELTEREIKIKEKENELEEELRKEKTRFELEEKNKVRGELSIYYEDSKKLVEERLDKEIDKRRKEELKEIETEKGKKLKELEELKKEIDKIESQKSENEKLNIELNFEKKKISQDRENLEIIISEKMKEKEKAYKAELEAKTSKVDSILEYYQELVTKKNQYEIFHDKYGGIQEIEGIINQKEKEIDSLREDLAKRPTIEALEEYDKIKQEFENCKKVNQKLNKELSNYNNEIIEIDVLKREKRNLMNQIDSLTLDYSHEKEEKDKLNARLSRIMTPEGTLLTEAERIQQIKGSGLDYEVYPEKYSENDINELSWLENIEKTSEEYGIKLNKRILYAFHTALKISDWSIITVLAGVSGTGKSELPKLYARFGGLNFISVPVQPNWDSQESMLGYFNSIDNRFDTQPLLRFLVNCIDEEKYNKYMSLVLLDEMNLAHVEHYFAEFLSKLEERRGKNKNDLPYIEVKLGADCNSLKLNLIRNILWAGTMNQDETTKSLSDKVLDRGIIINFPRPKTLESRKEMKSINKIIKDKKSKMLPREIWDKWVINRKEDSSSDAQKNRMKEYKRIIEEINDELEKVGRALGHRVWQSIEHYIFNHPYVSSQYEIEKKQGKTSGDELSNELKNNMDLAFEDQIVQKVMPKLRGIETRGKGEEVLKNILNILLNENFSNLDKDFKFAKEQGFGQFVWGSAYYLNEGEFELSSDNNDDEIEKEE